jgi:peptidoglycan/xylan/chitin deacetylase (PgdA/CDA1 family)
MGTRAVAAGAPSGPGPVFVYHRLVADSGDLPRTRAAKYWLRTSRFREHVTEVRRQGLEAVTAGEFWAGQSTRPVVLTFDDGCVSDYETVFPILASMGMRATFFLNTSTAGTPGFLSWEQIHEMKRGGMSFQSHSHQHAYLTRLPKAELERQVRHSKAVLEDNLGSRVDFLAAPYGDVDRRVVAEAIEAGYRAVCTSWNRQARPGQTTIDRLGIYSDTTAEEFRRLLANDAMPRMIRMSRDLAMYFPKRLLLSTGLLRAGPEGAPADVERI